MPGPASKHSVNYALVEDRIPFYASIKTMTGRETEKEGGCNGLSKIKKDRSVGPASYSKSNVDNGFKRLSSVARAPIAQFSGLGAYHGTRDNIKHAEKLKVKSNRCFD